MRRIGFGLLAALAAGLGGGCKKAPPPAADAADTSLASHQPAGAGETLGRIHWLGMKHLSAQPNAAYFMTIWNLPESQRLEAQTLDKLAAAGSATSSQFSVIADQPPTTNHLPREIVSPEASNSSNGSLAHVSPPGLESPISRGKSSLTPPLRPLLDDLVQAECYAEVRQATNRPGELALAIRLNAARAAVWETNLALFNNTASASRITHHASRPFTVTRAGQWTIVGLSAGSNFLVQDFAGRVRRDGIPFALPATNFWLDASLDLRRIAAAMGWHWDLPDDWPKISTTVLGAEDDAVTRKTGEALRTWAQLDFPEPLALQMEPWNIPTNLIFQPLISFTAIRGVGPWLASLKTWNDLQIGAPPNQVFFWAQRGFPSRTFFAAPMANPTNFVGLVRDRLVEAPWSKTNVVGQFEAFTKFTGVYWKGQPLLKPFLESIPGREGEFALGGLGARGGTNDPAPPELLQEIRARTNLVYYDWELTGPRIDAWTFMAQQLRLAFKKARFTTSSPSPPWFKRVALMLGNCGTIVTRTGPAQLTFVRNSSAGFTAVEFQLLCDWLESPRFPLGLYTFEAPVNPSPLWPSLRAQAQNATNSAPPK